MSETTHTLRSGNTVTLCEPHQVPKKYVRRITNATMRLSAGAREFVVAQQEISDVIDTLTDAEKETRQKEVAEGLMKNLTAEDLEILDESTDLSASALIVGWSFEPFAGKRPTADEVAELPVGDYDEITELVAPMAAALVSGVDFDPHPDKDRPTNPSNA